MWNPSYRWQRRARWMAGVAVLVFAVTAAIGLSRSTASLRAWNGVRELAGEIRPSAERQFEVEVPIDLAARAGTLVYEDRDDGAAQVIGRVVDVRDSRPTHAQLTIRLMGPLAGPEASGVLRGASAPLDLRDAMRLLVSPESPGDEVRRARDAIWPSVTKSVLPSLTDGLIQELSRAIEILDENDRELLAGSFQRFDKDLKPFEDELVSRLANRAWNVIGVSGVAAGLWHTTANNVQNQGTVIAYWLWQLFGDQPATQPVARPFLSEETTADLQAALKDEAVVFWHEHRTEIVAAIIRVVEERRPEIESAFRERWAGKLFDRAVVPAWQAGEQAVLAAAQDYVNDFAARKLVTKDGGPRLIFAFALRSALDISDDPLLIFSRHSAGEPVRVEYEPLIR